VTVEKGGGAWGPLHWSKVSESDFVSGVGHFGHDVENRFGSVFEDGLNFRPLHGEEVEQSLGHEGDQALDDSDGGVGFRGPNRSRSVRRSPSGGR
jgi:hypothetical protein